VLDYFFYEGSSILFRVALAILWEFKARILEEKDSAKVLFFLKDLKDIKTEKIFDIMNERYGNVTKSLVRQLRPQYRHTVTLSKIEHSKAHKPKSSPFKNSLDLSSPPTKPIWSPTNKRHQTDLEEDASFLVVK
jgi:hypothetical protein